MVQEKPDQVVRPNSPSLSGFPSGGQSSGGGFRKLAELIAPSILVLIIIYFVLLPSYQTKTDSDAKLGVIIGNVNTLTNMVKGDQGTITTLSTQLAGINGQIQQIQTSVSSLSSTVAKIGTIQQALDSLKSTVDNLVKSQPDLTPLKTQINGLQTTLDAVKADVAVLKTSPSVPVSVPPTITSFSPTSGASGIQVIIIGTNFNATTSVTFGGIAAQSFVVNSGSQITAVIGSGATGAVVVTTPAGSVTDGTFTYTGSTTTGTVTISAISDLIGQPYVAFNNVTANSTTSRQFMFTLNNNTGKQITSVQLLVYLQGYNANLESTDFPIGTIVKLSSPSLIGTLWSPQLVGSGYAFINQAFTGVLSGLGAITQNSGSIVYTMTVTITTGNNPVTSLVDLYPSVKVMSYQ